MITPEQLNNIEELAGLFFTLEEISLLAEIDISELRREVNYGSGEIHSHYWRGKLTALKEIRKSTKEFAEKGSPQAEAQLIEYLKLMNESER